MKNSSRLMGAVAPLALMGAVLVPAPAVQAAETATPRPIPKIRIPTGPVKIEKVPRILTQTPTPDAEGAESEEERVRVDAAEETPTATIRKRIGTQRIESTGSAEVENKLRVRTPMLTPVDEEAAAELATPRRVRVGTPQVDSARVEIENTAPIRIRVARPVDEAADEQAPPTRRRIGPPVAGGILAKVPDGPIRAINAAQTDCLFRPGKNPAKKAQSSSSEAVNILALVCRVNGKAALMSFLYDMPADNSVSDPRSLASQNHEAGKTSVIGYEIDPNQIDASGKPVYQLLSVGIGEQSRRKADCVDATSSFSLTTSEDAEGSVVEKWCSDGSNVFPVSFKVNRWLREKITPSISTTNPNDKRSYHNIQSVVFDDAIAADANDAVLIRETVPQLNERGWDCKLFSRDPGSLYCESDPVQDSGDVGTQTTFIAYSLLEVRSGIGPLGHDGCENIIGSPYHDSSFRNVAYSPGVTEATRYYDYKKATCTNFRVAYRLLPGTVAKEHRSLVGGACRIAASAGVYKDVTVTEAWSRKTKLTKENNMVMEQPLGESGGVPKKINKVKAPCL